MITKWNNLKSQFFKILGKNKEKKYLEKLVQNLEYCQNENKFVSFIIKSQKKYGFVVKVAGLFAYVPFNRMPWKYKNLEYWNVISKYLIGEKFYCNIYQIKKNPLSIYINAEKHRFDELDLELNSQIEGVILARAKYGIFVEIGSFFNWKYGSFVCLLHKSNFKDFDLLKSIEIGKEVLLIFYGYNKENRMILGDKYLSKGWLTGSLDNLIGTNHKVKVTINENGKKEYYIKDMYKALLPVSILLYPEYSLVKIQKIISNLKNNQTINCKVVEVRYKSRKLIIKLNLKIEKMSTVHFKHKIGNLVTDKLKEKLKKLTDSDN